MVSDRRSFLAVISTAMAGCSGVGGKIETTATETTTNTTAEQTQTETSTVTVNPTTTETQLPSKVTDGLLEVEFSSWIAAEYLRYYDSESDELKRLEPENEWWVSIMLNVRNLGGKEQMTPATSSLSLTVQGEKFEAITAYPKVSLSELRLREKYRAYFRYPEFSGARTLRPGERRIDQPIFDIPKAEHPVLTWDGPSGKHRLEKESIAITPES